MHDRVDKVLIISLDGATLNVLLPLVRQGYMPTIKTLLANGVATELESVVPPVTAPAWTSFMTGKNPNKHGIFDFTRFDAQTYEWKINNSQHIRSNTIWQILSKHNKRSIVVGLPYTYPPYKINGMMISGWDAPSTISFTYPCDLSDKVKSIVPSYGIDADLSLWNHLSTTSTGEFDTFITKLIRSFDHTATLASHLMKSEPWDVFMVHFQQTDWIQHKLWGYIQEACHNADDKTDRLERVRRCYRAFDKQVGRLLAELPESTLRIVLSDHGFGPNRGTICPNYTLRELGHYHLKSDKDTRFKHAIKHSHSPALRRLYRGATNIKNSMLARTTLKRYGSWADMVSETVSTKGNVDWSRTKAAFVGGSEAGFIFINTKGIAPQGCVNPGEEYRELASTIINSFTALKHPGTGNPLLRHASLGRDIYASATNGIRLPDIVLQPVEGYVVGAGVSEPFLPAKGDKGDHRQSGVLFINGAGTIASTDKLLANLIDIAPSILHALNLPIPSDMDGKVLEILPISSRAVKYEEPDENASYAATDYNQHETKLIEQRLRGLGYVE